MNNDIMLDGHLAWCQLCVREHQDSSVGWNSTDPHCELHPHDVLFAGRKFSGNGNEVLRLMAMQYAQAYAEGNAKERRNIVETMVEEIRDNGGRFLKLDTDGSSWIEVLMPEVREKIGQMFRNLRRPRASQQQKTAFATVNHLPLIDEADISPNDILFGRKVVGHDGNQRLRQMVEAMAVEYDAASRGRKKQLIDSLVETIKSANGRFLRHVEGAGKWQEVLDEAIIFSKVSAHFRNFRRQSLKKPIE